MKATVLMLTRKKPKNWATGSMVTVMPTDMTSP
jgi:hypothetical protein